MSDAPANEGRGFIFARQLYLFSRHKMASQEGEAMSGQPPVTNVANDLQRRVYDLIAQERPEAALVLVDAAIAGHAHDVEMLLTRGDVLLQLQRYDDACDAYRHGRTLEPGNVRAWAREGAVLLRLQRVEDALAAFDAALKLARQVPGTWYNRGVAYGHLNRLAEAIADYEKAIELGPDYGTAHVNRAMALLLQGRYREGLAALEWRFMIEPGNRELRVYRQPRWRKGNAIAGKRILLYAEQGIGDVIQFARYVPEVVAQAAHVTVEVQPSLVRLLKTLPCEVIANGTPSPPFNLHSPLASLGTLLDVQLETIPAHVPYLTAPSEDVARWRTRLAGLGGKLKVGLAWAGNPHHTNDYNRSIPFAEMAALLDVPDIAFVGLQKDLRESDRAAFERATIFDAAGELGDLADTAALIENLDLVITCDSALAHLAGALGKRTWILLPFAPDWRWMLERSDSPWYPSARLFRQNVIGDWRGVINNVMTALTA